MGVGSVQWTHMNHQQPERKRRTSTKIEFSTLADFIHEVKDANIQIVRFDVVEKAEQSELSFIFYVSSMLYVTAQSFSGRCLYEYSEWLGSAASVDHSLPDDSLVKLVTARTTDVGAALRAAELQVRHGRFVVPYQAHE